MEDKVGKSEWHANVTPPIATSPQCSACFTEQNILVAKLNAGCKIENVQTPILASWKKKSLILWDMWDKVITICDFPTSFRFHFGLHV